MMRRNDNILLAFPLTAILTSLAFPSVVLIMVTTNVVSRPRLHVTFGKEKSATARNPHRDALKAPCRAINATSKSIYRSELILSCPESFPTFSRECPRTCVEETRSCAGYGPKAQRLPPYRHARINKAVNASNGRETTCAKAEEDWKTEKMWLVDGFQEKLKANLNNTGNVVCGTCPRSLFFSHRP